MEPTSRTLFANQRLVARAVAQGTGSTCFVTFDSFTDRPTLDRPGFGEHYFATRGVDAIHVLSLGNHWYQYPELDALLAAVAEATAGYERVVAYGSSMGGFAALTYGARCGAQVGLALSPQYSIDPRVATFERRWPGPARAIRFRREQVAPLPWQVIAYDPHDADDRRHLALYAARSSTVGVRVPYGGHPVGGYLAETSLLTPLIEGVVAGALDGLAFERTVRAERRRSGQYHFTLSRRLADRHLPAKLALARVAAALSPHDAAYHSQFGLLLDQAGARGEARVAHHAAVALESASHHTLYNLVRHHEQAEEHAQARALVERLLATGTAPAYFRQAFSRIRRAQRQATPLGRLAREYRVDGAVEALALLRDALVRRWGTRFRV